MRRLGGFVLRRRRHVLVVAALLIPVAAFVGGSAEKHLSSGGFLAGGAESTVATEALLEHFDRGQPNLVLLVTAREGTVDRRPAREAGTALTTELAAEPSVEQAESYWSLGAPPLRSVDGRQALVLARIPGTDDEVVEQTAELAPRYTRSSETIEVTVGGSGQIYHEITAQADEDLIRAEIISIPITLALLVLVFGGVVAAGLPLGIGVIAIVFTLAILRTLAAVTEVSIFALNLTTTLGLGLAIDYSLFIVSRFREEMNLCSDVDLAILRTMHTAGRTVAFSAVTVAISLAALILFPLSFLRSFAYAGVAVVAAAGVTAVIVLPAALATLGPRVNRWAIRTPRQRPFEQRFWYRRARSVMRRPGVIALGVTVFLVALGMPFLRLELGIADDRVLPDDAPGRIVHEHIRTNFSSGETFALSVVASSMANGVRAEQIDPYAAELSNLAGVARVDAPTGFYVGGQAVAGPNDLSDRFTTVDAVWISVVPDIDPLSAEGQRLVEAIRSTNAPFPVAVGGLAAELVDTRDALFARLPIAITLIALVTFALLFLMVGSLLVPLKALVLNLFSLTATFGALVWIFQDGNLSGLLGFTPIGTIPVFLPMSLFCIAFGLSMDYEVFLLARIKEEYDTSRDNEGAIARGLELSGRIISAAALLLCVVFLTLATAEVSIVKMFGVGLTLAVLVDAFIIRATLTPALMKLAGRANWWAPRRLRRFHLRFGIWEPEPLRILERQELARDPSPSTLDL